MKEQILKLIQEKPKHYSLLIKRDVELKTWVEDNAVTKSDHFPSMIYSAVFKADLICDHNKHRKLNRWSEGLIGCGPAASCECTKKSIALNVSKTKSNIDPSNSNKKREKTMIEKYGVSYNSQRSDVKEILSKPKISKEAYNKLSNKDWITEEYVTKNRSSVDIAQELGVYYSTVASYCISHGLTIKRRSNYSMTEIEIGNYIQSLGYIVQYSNWDILGNKEIDITVPEKNLLIEVNGLYWHSFNPSSGKIENPKQHIDKTKSSTEKGYELVHITDYEWNNKKDIIKSILSSKLGCNKKVYARKTKIIKSIPSKELKEFLNKNHIQGYCVSSQSYGLVDTNTNELLQVITIGKNRFSKNHNEIEIYRIATKQNITVVGGVSKLLKIIKNENQNYKIISYCDISKSTGNLYLTLGFIKESETGPGYFWTDGTEIISRFKARKNTMEKFLINYNPEKSQTENMFSNNYRRYWDCGSFKFILV